MTTVMTNKKTGRKVMLLGRRFVLHCYHDDTEIQFPFSAAASEVLRVNFFMIKPPHW